MPAALRLLEALGPKRVVEHNDRCGMYPPMPIVGDGVQRQMWDVCGDVDIHMKVWIGSAWTRG